MIIDISCYNGKTLKLEWNNIVVFIAVNEMCVGKIDRKWLGEIAKEER